jgi:hypothetical protein
MPDNKKQPIVFISYSHLDEPDEFLHPGETRWLTYVSSHLKPAAAHGKLELWDDRRIDGGGDWRREIDDALNRCAVCIFLVSRNSLSSRFILDIEIKQMLERHHAGGAHLYPIVITSVDLGAAPWLLRLNLKPTNGTALELYESGPRNKVMSDLAAEIRQIIERAAVDVAVAKENRSEVGVPSLIDYGRLPETPYAKLVGREAELKQLDETWADEKINILSLVADGGVGKSALINAWLVRIQADGYRGADAVLGWSFFSQGSEQRATSAEPFLNWALEKLGITIDSTSSTVKAERLAEAMAQRRILVVLDGVEPLQHGPGPQQGQLKDHGLRALLRRFAQTSFAGQHSLVVVTSRLAITDIQRWKDGSAPVRDLGFLRNDAGAELLESYGVHGPRVEMVAASREAGGHALTLTLMAGFLRELYDSDVRRRRNITGWFGDPAVPGAHGATLVMESYEKEWLADQPLLLAIMHIVGLFDRPASADCLKALRKKPAIKGLTDAIVGIDDASWRHAVARLRDVRLLSPQDHGPTRAVKHPFIPAKAGIQPGRDKLGPRLRGDERSFASDTLDAHPLVREWFGESLHRKNEAVWKAAHSRLYDHLRDTTKEGDRPTLEDLAPLYQAVAHGCRAGRYQEALSEVYINRICRRRPDGHLEFYASDKLGALGSDLAAITWFFEKPYEAPVATLDEAARSWVLGQASFFLRAQGRFAEALPPLRAGLRLVEGAKEWVNVAIGTSNLSEAELVVGEVASAVATAERAVAHADRSSDAFRMMGYRTTQADALHAAGARAEAAALFADAERRQQERQPEYPLLYSLQGYLYCDLLLGKGDWAAARDRAARTLEWAKPQNFLLDIALDTLTLGRAHLGLALAAASERSDTVADRRCNARTACARLDEAIDGLRAAGHLQHISVGLIARAAFRRSIGDWQGAARDLDEVEEIAEQGPMKLYLCDMAIERARLAFARIEAFAPLNGLLETDNPPKPAAPSAEEIARLKEEAAAQLKIAADYISSCGYHRRDEELAELQAVLRGERKFADLPPRV